jgi:hypothetical protein
MCYALSSVVIPASVTYIGDNAFLFCYSLRSIVIPASVTYVGNNAFYRYSTLSSVTILAPGLALPATVFNDDYALTAMSIYNPDAPESGTLYIVADAANPGAIVVYYDDSLGGDVYAKQSPSKGSLTLSGFPDMGAARIGTKTWIADVYDLADPADYEQMVLDGYALTALDGVPFPTSKLGGARTIYASFGYYYVVSASIANGEIAPSGDVGVVGGEIRVAAHGDATFEFAANPGYALRSVEIDGDGGSPKALAALATGTHTFPGVLESHTISVETERLEFVVTASADSNSTIAPAGSMGVARGGSASFAFSAGAGYAIADVVVDGASVPSAAASGSYTFDNVTSNHTISVTSAPSVGNPDIGDGSGDGEGGADSTPSGTTDILAIVVAAICIVAASLLLLIALARHRSKESKSP